jgi:parallel beta-helix repeat protein
MKNLIRLCIPAAALAMAFAAAPAAAQALTCGDTVTNSIKLKADLDCSAEQSGGLLVGASGITIDLNGHSIIGSGGADQYEGIENDGYNRVKIVNGSIRNFQDDVLLLNTAKNVVDHVHLSLDDYNLYNGIYSTYGTGNTFSNNKVNRANYAIYMQSGSANKVTSNKLIDAGYGVYTKSEAQDRIKKNHSSGFSITTNGFWSDGDYATKYKDDVANDGYRGFYATGPRNVVYDSVKANANGFAGIYIENNPSSLYGEYSANVVNSTASNNAEYGMYAQYGIPSKHNTALGNDYYNCVLVRCNG